MRLTGLIIAGLLMLTFLGVVSQIPGASAVTIDIQIGTGLDDGWTRTGDIMADDIFLATSTTLLIGTDTRGFFDAFALYTSVTIPAGSVIDVAHMRVQASGLNVGGADILTNLTFEDADNPVAPTSKADHDGRVRTSAVVPWDNNIFVVDVEVNSPSIAAVIQELVDRPGWSSGNSMLFLWDDDGSTIDGHRYVIYSFEGNSARDIILHVEYSSPWTNTAPVIFQTFTTDEGGHNISYTAFFNATDIDTNQTLFWTLATNLSSLGIQFENRSAWVNGTPTFAERDDQYFVNVTAADQGCAGACNLTDSLNYTLFINNTIISISNAISTDTGRSGTPYSQDFNHADANNDTPAWSVLTDAPFVLTVSATGTVSGVPNATGVFWINVSVRDYQGGQSGSDFSNYTLVVREQGSLTDAETMILWLFLILMLVLFVVGPIFRFWFLWMLAGIVGVLLGLFTFDLLGNFTLTISIMGFGGFLLVGGVLLTIAQGLEAGITGRRNF